MLVALEMAVRERDTAWTTAHELSAVTAEVTHALLLTTLKVNGAKNIGKSSALRFPRPWDEKQKKDSMITMGQFARRVKGADHA